MGLHSAEKIHTHSKEGHWKFLWGGVVLKARILEAKYEAKLEFPGGGGGMQCGVTVVSEDRATNISKIM